MQSFNAHSHLTLIRFLTDLKITGSHSLKTEIKKHFLYGAPIQEMFLLWEPHYSHQFYLI